MTIRRPLLLNNLLERVKTAADVRGKKVELARFIGSSKQQVNGWLTGAKMPGGEVALLMLQWVTAEEAEQQKTAPVLLTPERRKTRKLNQANEKDSRVPKRK